MTFENYSPVRLITDKYEAMGVPRGTTGTIVEVWDETHYEVDFTYIDGNFDCFAVAEDEIQLVERNSTMLDWFKKLWDYNYWGHHQMLDCVAQLSEDDFKKEVDYSMGSVHRQIVHVMWAESVWYARIHNLPRPDYTVDDYSTVAAIREKWIQVESDWLIYLDKLSEADLNTVITYQRGNGETLQNPVYEILGHVVNHGTDHRAQILQLCHTYNAPTFEQDLFFYYREKRKK